MVLCVQRYIIAVMTLTCKNLLFNYNKFFIKISKLRIRSTKLNLNINIMLIESVNMVQTVIIKQDQETLH